MKTIWVFIFAAFLTSCSQKIYKSKINPDYRSMAKFKISEIEPVGADTADYLHFNFIVHKDRYLGKKFKELVRDLNLSISRVIVTPESYKMAHIDDVSLYFYNISYVRTGVEYCLVVKLQDTFSFYKYSELTKKSNGEWSKEQYEFLKDRRIKDIILGDSRNWHK